MRHNRYLGIRVNFSIIMSSLQTTGQTRLDGRRFETYRSLRSAGTVLGARDFHEEGRSGQNPSKATNSPIERAAIRWIWVHRRRLNPLTHGAASSHDSLQLSGLLHIQNYALRVKQNENSGING